MTAPNSDINNFYMEGSAVKLLGKGTTYCKAKKIKGTPHTNKATMSSDTCNCFNTNFADAGCQPSSFTAPITQ